MRRLTKNIAQHLFQYNGAAVWLVLGLTACQTIPKEGASDPKAILATQKQIIANLLDSGNASKALQDVRNLVKQYPNDPELLNLMGLVQLALSNHPAAIQFLASAYKVDHRLAFGLNLSSAQMAARQFDQAALVLAELEKNPEFATYDFPERVYHNQGVCAEAQGKDALAEALYNKALSVNPTFHLTTVKLAEMKARKGQIHTARALLRRAVQNCPSCFDAVDLLARNYMQTGSKGAAAQVLKQYLRQSELLTHDRVNASKLLRMAEASGAK